MYRVLLEEVPVFQKCPLTEVSLLNLIPKRSISDIEKLCLHAALLEFVV